MFSIIMPTLWVKPHITKKLLDTYLESPHINEIIIISNAACPLNIDNEKINLLEQKENLYVNPSWNLGVSKSKNDNIILSNDDIIIPSNLIDYLNTINISNYGVIGINTNSYSELKKIEDLSSYQYNNHKLLDCKTMNYGFGTFMFLHKSKYHVIPENIKIYCGDNYLFEKNKHNNATIITNIKTEMSSSSDLKHFDSIKIEDMKNFAKII